LIPGDVTDYAASHVHVITLFDVEGCETVRLLATIHREILQNADPSWIGSTAMSMNVMCAPSKV
jgi:hypothetical protein